MSNYSIKEDYIGDLIDMESNRSLTDNWEFYGYLALAFIAGIGVGIIMI